VRARVLAVIHGIDRAIRERRADYTANGEVFYVDGALKGYIRQNPYSAHVNLHDFLQSGRTTATHKYRSNQCYARRVSNKVIESPTTTRSESEVT
jgi:hypothetical protein